MEKEGLNSDILSAIKSVKYTQENIPFFLQVLQESNNRDIWMMLPLCISKTHDERLVPVLIQLLQDSRTRNCRGNFLTALKEYDYSCYYELLVDLVCHDNWEVRMKSASMLIDIKERIPKERLPDIERKINRALSDADDKCMLLCDLCEELGLSVDED